MKNFLKDSKPPLKKWKRLMIIITLVTVIAYVTFMGAYFATSFPRFCGSCHEVNPYYVTWQSSPHKNVGCLYCHEFRGFLGKLHSKARGLNYVYQHITRQYTVTANGIAFEQNCIGCHLGDYWNYPNTKRLDMKHYEYIKSDKSCFQCHRDTGHKVKIFSQEKFNK